MKPLEERSIASVSMAIKLHNGIIKYLFIPVHKQNRERRTVYGLWFMVYGSLGESDIPTFFLS
jgi:hypothetical protein